MNKKDYIVIAKEFADSRPVQVNQSNEFYFGQCAVWENHVMRFCSMLAQQNPRFNRAKFLQACGYNE